MDCSLPHSFVHRISQVRIMKCVAISFPRGSSQPGMEAQSPIWQADFLPLSHLGNPYMYIYLIKFADSRSYHNIVKQLCSNKN